jgi:hypothetical protein
MGEQKLTYLQEVNNGKDKELQLEVSSSVRVMIPLSSTYNPRLSQHV